MNSSPLWSSASVRANGRPSPYRSIAVHPEDNLVTGLVFRKTDIDAVLAVFDGVGNKVGEYLLYAVRGAHGHDRAFRNIDIHRDVPLLHGSGEIVAGLAKDGLQVLLGEVQLQLLLFHLAQIKELVG